MDEQNLNPLAAIANRVAAKGTAEGLPMRNLGEHVRQLKARRGWTMTELFLITKAEQLGELADSLVLQTDDHGNPRMVFIVGANTPAGLLAHSDEEFQQVRAAFSGSVFPVSFVEVTLTATEELGPNVRFEPLNFDPSAPADDEE